MISVFGLFAVRARLRQLLGMRIRNLPKLQNQRAKKGMTVRKCVSESRVNIIIVVDVQPCSGKDEQAASSNPGSGGSSTKETTPTNTPPAGGSNNVSKTAESSSDNAEPMEH